MNYFKVIPLLFVGLLGNVNGQNKLSMLYGSSGMEYGKASAIDADTCYINGSLFQNTIQVNPNGITELSSPSAATEIALCKYNSRGKLLWAKSFGGPLTSEAPHGISCDAQRNIYVAGYFGSVNQTGPVSASFNPDGGNSISTEGNEDCFVAKYDKDGKHQWSFGLGNQGKNTQERAWDIVSDSEGNIFVCGGVHGTINFNPLGAAMNYSLPDTLAGIFIAKYSNQGICQWVNLINTQCTNVFTEAYATCDLDKFGNLYLAGNLRGNNVQFNLNGSQTSLNSNGQTDLFISRLDVQSGLVNWVRKIGGPAAEIVSPGALRCDHNGNPYFSGRLSGTNTVDFDPSQAIQNVSNSSLFLVSYDSAGLLRHVTGMNSGIGDGGHRVAFDKNNNVYIAGWMNGTASFGSKQITAKSATADVFLAKYSNDLSTCYWALNFGGNSSSANSICAGLSTDQEDNLLITGQLYGTEANINPLDNQNPFLLSSVGQNDCFLIKYNSDGKLWENKQIPIGLNQNEPLRIQVYPNPASENLYVRHALTNKINYTLKNLLGQTMAEGTIEEYIYLSNLESGIYLLEIYELGGRRTEVKLIKQ